MNETVISEKAQVRRRRARETRSLGPVSNLEEHVRPDWWRKIFNSTYLKTDADVVDDQNITRNEVIYFSELLHLAAEDEILDLCCGQGRHSLELARSGFKRVEGLDRSHYLIQKAKTQAKKEGLALKFREGDARRLSYPPDSFDVVMLLGNSFGYFETVQDDLRVLKEIFRILKPWGRFMIDVADGAYLKEHFQPRSWEWIDKNLFVCRERSLALDGQRLISREVVTHVEKGVIVDQLYAERLYTREKLFELLKTAGFSEITTHGELLTDSQRNQDLGLMEKRILVTARVRKEWSPVKTKKRRGIKHVAVIMGDPDKPDYVKPFCSFDDDDFYTIDQLKGALRELKDFRFTYLCNHNTLIQDLVKKESKIDFVFNLCDEGYLNDAKKELHVPAILDMLGIHYTGSGPQCLAFCFDKSLVRGIAKEMEIPVPAAVFIKPEDSTFELQFDFPVLVKPNFGDSSFGITQLSVCYGPEELTNAISEIRERLG